MIIQVENLKRKICVGHMIKLWNLSNNCEVEKSSELVKLGCTVTGFRSNSNHFLPNLIKHRQKVLRKWEIRTDLSGIISISKT